MAVTDEQHDELRGRVHELEVGARGQLDLIKHVLGRLVVTDETLVTHTKLLVELRQGQDELRRGLDGLRQGQDELRRGLDELRRGLDELRRGLDEVRQGQDEQRRGLDEMKERQSRTEETVAALSAKLDALPRAIVALLRPSND
jgi:chromosome segregation ATPase